MKRDGGNEDRGNLSLFTPIGEDASVNSLVYRIRFAKRGNDVGPAGNPWLEKTELVYLVSGIPNWRHIDASGYRGHNDDQDDSRDSGHPMP